MAGSVIKNEKLFSDFIIFGRSHIASKDVDPMYVVLPTIYNDMGLDNNSAVWFTVLFLAWYNLGSAKIAFHATPVPRKITSAAKLRFGLDRRNLRSNEKFLFENIASFIDVFGTKMHDSISSLCCPQSGEAGWDALYEKALSVKHNGTWAAYKWCKLMRNCFAMPIQATNVGIGSGGENAGPIPMLVKLTGENWKRCANDVDLQKRVHEMMRASGALYDGLDGFDCGLCNFNGVTIGRYYLGKNIDAQQAAIQNDSEMMKARRVLPKQYRGELNGWSGVRKELLTYYRDKGILIT